MAFVKPMQHKSGKLEFFPCSVCTKLCLYNNHGVKCCDSCKLFFRRVVLKRLYYECQFDGQCQVIRRKRCPGCRLDECLKAGMEPRMVSMRRDSIASDSEKEYIRRLTARQAVLLGQDREEEKQPVPNMALAIQTSGSNWNLLNSLLELEQKQRIIWEADADPSLQYLDQFNSLEEMLSSTAGSIFDQIDNFNWCQPNTWDKLAYMELCDNYGMDNADSMRCIAVDMLLAVQLSKKMPCFQQLLMPDKICLLKQIILPFGIILNTHYSITAYSAETWTRSSGMTLASAFHIDQFKCDIKIAVFSIKMYLKSIEAIKNAKLGREEFMLLLAILLSSSNANGLSKEAMALLYSESCRYSALLLDLYQLKHGPAQGVSLFAEAIHLLEQFFHLANQFKMMSTYIEICYFPRNPNLQILKAMRAINFL